MPVSQELHYDKFLSNLSIEYKNDTMISDIVFPSVSVDNMSDRYKIWGEEAFAYTNDYRGETSIANEIDWTFSHDLYICEDHALAEAISWRAQKNSDDPQVLFERANKVLNAKVALGKEIRAAAAASNTSNYDADLVINTLAAEKWDDPDSDPIIAIENVRNIMHQKAGVDPNTLILPREVWSKLRTHPKLLAIFKNSEVSIVPMSYLKDWLEIDNIIVAPARKATSKDGSGTKTSIWGNNAYLLHITPTPGEEVVTFGYTFEFNGYDTGAKATTRIEDERRRATIIEVGYYYDVKIISNIAGAIFPNIIT